jgi:hypothetical protein
MWLVHGAYFIKLTHLSAEMLTEHTHILLHDKHDIHPIYHAPMYAKIHIFIHPLHYILLLSPIVYKSLKQISCIHPTHTHTHTHTFMHTYRDTHISHRFREFVKADFDGSYDCTCYYLLLYISFKQICYIHS